MVAYGFTCLAHHECAHCFVSIPWGPYNFNTWEDSTFSKTLTSTSSINNGGHRDAHRHGG